MTKINLPQIKTGPFGDHCFWLRNPGQTNCHFNQETRFTIRFQVRISNSEFDIFSSRQPVRTCKLHSDSRVRSWWLKALHYRLYASVRIRQRKSFTAATNLASDNDDSDKEMLIVQKGLELLWIWPEQNANPRVPLPQSVLHCWIAFVQNSTVYTKYGRLCGFEIFWGCKLNRFIVICTSNEVRGSRKIVEGSWRGASHRETAILKLRSFFVKNLSLRPKSDGSRERGVRTVWLQTWTALHPLRRLVGMPAHA